MTFVRTPPPKAPAAQSFVPAVDNNGDPSITDDALDELTALFLTPSQPSYDQRPVDSPAASKAITELILPGHLPVRGNLWLAPCADAIAQQLGCCTLLRIDDADEFSVQVLRGGDLPSPCPDATARQVIQTFASQTRIWMVRPSMPLDVHQLVTAGADRLTIFTGTDGISVVAAYQLIKDFATAASNAGVALPRLALAVVGADEESAREMVRRINLTATSLVESAIELRLSLPRIDAIAPASQHVSFSGEPAPTVSDLIQWINEAKQSTAGTSRPDAEQRAMPQQESPRESHPTPPFSNGREQHEPVDEPGERRSSETLRLAPKPSASRRTQASTSPAAATANPGLTQHIVGLQPLGVRCPQHEMIELAVDDAGTLQIVSRDSDLRSLFSVKAWANAHRNLLAKACSEFALDLTTEPVCHVITETPASVADLHGSDLRLHVVAPVQVNGQTAWYAAPLN